MTGDVPNVSVKGQQGTLKRATSRQEREQIKKESS